MRSIARAFASRKVEEGSDQNIYSEYVSLVGV